MNPAQPDLSEFTSTGELEEVLTGKNRGKETQPLLHNRPRSCSNGISANSVMSCGVYNKSNYLSSCYNTCWIKNGRHGPRTQRLLCFGGGFSRCGSILAGFILYLFALLPFAAVWPFFIGKDSLKTDYVSGWLILTTIMEFVFYWWHFYCVYVMKTKNNETWVSSWFTFLVNKDKLGNTLNSQGSLSWFDLPGKLRIIDVSVPDLCRLSSALHQLTVDDREKLATRIEKNKLDQAAIILYTEEFINEFIKYCMYEAFVLASLSAFSFALLSWKTIKTFLM